MRIWLTGVGSLVNQVACFYFFMGVIGFKLGIIASLIAMVYTS